MLRHAKEVDGITASHKENVANVEKQYSFWMQKKEEETATFVGEFDEYRDRTKKEIKRSRGIACVIRCRLHWRSTREFNM